MCFAIYFSSPSSFSEKICTATKEKIFGILFLSENQRTVSCPKRKILGDKNEFKINTLSNWKTNLISFHLFWENLNNNNNDVIKINALTYDRGLSIVMSLFNYAKGRTCFKICIYKDI